MPGYAGFGYNTGLVQALSGQLQGEAQADEIARKQQQIQFQQQIELNHYLAQQQEMLQMGQIRANQDVRSGQTADLQRDQYERQKQKDEWWWKIQQDKANKPVAPKTLTPIQQITVGEKAIGTQDRLAQAQELSDLIDTAPETAPVSHLIGKDDPGGAIDDSDGGISSRWHDFFGRGSKGEELVPMPRTKAEAKAMLQRKIETGRKMDALFGGALGRPVTSVPVSGRRNVAAPVVAPQAGMTPTIQQLAPGQKAPNARPSAPVPPEIAAIIAKPKNRVTPMEFQKVKEFYDRSKGSVLDDGSGYVF